MPITFINQNIFRCKTHAIVNTVNLQGAMGKGLALAFKLRFESYYKSYQHVLSQKQIEIGKMHWYRLIAFEDPEWLVSFPTKDRWWNDSQIEYIEKGLVSLREDIISKNIRSIAIPKLGCNNGKLEWAVVRPLIVNALQDLDCDVWILGEAE